LEAVKKQEEADCRRGQLAAKLEKKEAELLEAWGQQGASDKMASSQALDEATAKVSLLESTAETVADEIDVLQGRVSGLERELRNEQEKAVIFKRESERQKERADALAEELAPSQIEAIGLATMIKALTDAKTALGQEVSELRDSVSALTLERSTFHKGQLEAEAKLDESGRESAEINAIFKVREEEHHKRATRLEELEQDIKDAKRAEIYFERQEEAMMSMAGEIAELTGSLQEAEGNASAANIEMDQMSVDLEDCNARVAYAEELRGKLVQDGVEATLLEEVTRLEGDVKALEADVSARDAEIQKLRAPVPEMRPNIHLIDSKVKESIAKKESEVVDVLAQIEGVQREMAAAQLLNETLQKELAQANEVIESLKGELSTLKRNTREEAIDIKSLSEELQKSQTEISKLRKQLTVEAAIAADATKEGAETRKKLEAMESQTGTTQGQVQELEKRLDCALKEKDGASEKEDKLERLVQKHEATLKQKEVMIEDLKSRAEASFEVVAANKAKQDESQKIHDKSLKDLEEANHENLRLGSKISTLEQEYKKKREAALDFEIQIKTMNVNNERMKEDAAAVQGRLDEADQVEMALKVERQKPHPDLYPNLNPNPNPNPDGTQG